MSNCIVCGRALKSKETIEKGMGKTCAKIFASYDSSTQQRLLQEYQQNRQRESYDNPIMVNKSKAENLVELIKTTNLANYQESMNKKIAGAEEPEKSLYEQQLWETEQNMIAVYEREQAKDSRLPKPPMPDRFKNAVYQMYRREQMNLTPEQADSYLPAFRELLQEEEAKEQEKVEEEMMSFGVEFFDDADNRIDPNDKELPEDEPREYYENVLYSIMRDGDRHCWSYVCLNELNKESLYHVANLYYKLSKRYLPTLKNLPRMSTYKEFNKANQDTWTRFHVVTRDDPHVYEHSGAFYLSGELDKSYLPNTHPDKIREVGIYLNENNLNDSYTKMGDIYKKDIEHNGYGTNHHFAKVPDHIQYRDYVVVHEIGHLIHDSLNFHGKTHKQLETYFQENQEQVFRSLSRYASQNVNEMVAEAFADYSLNPTPSYVSVDVMNILNGHFYSNSRYSSVDPDEAKKVIKTAKFHKPSQTKEILQTLLKRS